MSYLLGDTFALLANPDRIDWPDGQRPACILTSVPYWSQRHYSTHETARPWGASGESLQTWLDNAAEFAAGCWRTLPANGWCAVNVGDSRTGSGGAGGDYADGGGYAGRGRYRQGPNEIGGELLAPRQLAGIPGRLADAFRAQGFLVRAAIVWDKTSPKPEDINHVRRPLMQHEMVYLLAKGRPEYHPSGVVHRSDVWSIGRARLPRITPSPKAPWPAELVQSILGPLTRPGDVVLDPFAGCGMTGLVAEAMGRLPVMIDADPDALASHMALRPHAARIAKSLRPS